MTATHPPVMPLKPVRTGRPKVRVPAPEATAPSPEVFIPDTPIPDTPVPDSSRPQESAPQLETSRSDRSAVVTRDVFRGVLIGFRIAAFVALALLIYAGWSQNWIGNTADAAVTWYSTTVAPYLQVDFLGPEVPTVQDGLVGPMNEPSMVTTN